MINYAKKGGAGNSCHRQKFQSDEIKSINFHQSLRAFEFIEIKTVMNGRNTAVSVCALH